MDMDALKQMFFGECDDYLSTADEHLDGLNGGGDTADALNALFRAVHSIKGGARAFGIDELAEFAHVFETFMDTLRKGGRPLDGDNYGRLTLGFDMLAQLVAAARGEAAPTLDCQGFLRTLRRLDGDGGGDNETPVGGVDPGASEPEAVDSGGRSGSTFHHYRLMIVPADHMFTGGVDPLSVLRNLGELGLVTTSVDTSRLPPLEEMEIDVPYFRWTVELETEVDRSAFQDILDFIDDVATVEIEEIGGSDTEESGAPVQTLTITRAVVEPVVAVRPETRSAPVQSEMTPAASERIAPGVKLPVVRVDAHKLERLGNMVGELVIAQAVLQQQAADIPEADRPGLFRAIKDMSQYIRDLQDIALAVRAQPLRVAFSRLIPVARELERATGKKLRLVMSGDETEIDKTVVDRLAEPLTHLLRNSADHGIESPEARGLKGKSAVGTVVLSARQLGSQVFITVEDDGAGINRAAVRFKAIERGLIDPESELTESEVDNLIFLPGFSTAEHVTEVSGRGVGMDVVRQIISDFGGQIVVESTPGVGCRFTMVLPLSLAIVDVLVAEVGRQRYLLPIGNIVESVQPRPEHLVTIPGRGYFLHLRGGMLPIIALADEFEVPGAVTNPCLGILVIAELGRGQVAALLVDDVLGQEPVVVKSLERNYRKVPGVAAATILGDGRAALIIDYSSLGRVGVGAHRRTITPSSAPVSR